MRDWRAVALKNDAAAAQHPGLKRLLDYEEGPTYPQGYRTVNASVISFPSGPFNQQITIAAGSRTGIHLNTPIVTADGLVGRVTNVGPSTSVVDVDHRRRQRRRREATSPPASSD